MLGRGDRHCTATVPADGHQGCGGFLSCLTGRAPRPENTLQFVSFKSSSKSAALVSQRFKPMSQFPVFIISMCTLGSAHLASGRKFLTGVCFLCWACLTPRPHHCFWKLEVIDLQHQTLYPAPTSAFPEHSLTFRTLLGNRRRGLRALRAGGKEAALAETSFSVWDTGIQEPRGRP